MAFAFTDDFPLPMEWQVGKTLSESTVCLMRSGKFADVWFRCKDQDDSGKTNRVAAHKLILACRSQVFEAMFYGELAETSNEIALPEIEKIPFLLFLRYLYTDETDLSEEYAIEVMHIAHKYQVTTCLEYCSKFLKTILHVDNACRILENALLLQDKSLTRSTIDFIDDHATEVLESEGFTYICKDTLEYILKGNTFFAMEVDIMKAVDNWGVKYLEEQELEVSPANKRKAIGGAFNYLRMPTLSLRDFVASRFQYDYLTDEEENKISKFIIGLDGISHDMFMSCETRIPREAMCFMSSVENNVLTDPTPGQVLGDEVHLICTKDIGLKQIILSLKQKSETHAKCTIERSGDIKMVVVKEATLKPVNTNLTLSPVVSLQASSSPYKITVSLTVRGELADETLSFPQSTTGLGFSFGSTQQPGKGIRFGASFATVPGHQHRSTYTQTEAEIHDESPRRRPTTVSIYGHKGYHFIQGIKYTNNSNRV